MAPSEASSLKIQSVFINNTNRPQNQSSPAVYQGPYPDHLHGEA